MNYEMRKAKRKIALRVALFIAAILTPVIYTMPSYVAYAASGITITAHEDDFYNKLHAAALLHVVAWETKRCFGEEAEDSHHYSSSDVKKGKIIQAKGETRQISPWLEWKIDPTRTPDGKFHCWDGNEDNRNILHQFMHYFGMDNGSWGGFKYQELFCDGGGNGLIEKWSSKFAGIGEERQSSGCDKFDEDGYHWRLSPNWETYLEKAYNKRIEEQQLTKYAIPWNKLYGGFSNISGYFNYFEDFNQRCSDTVVSIYDESDEKRGDNRETYPIRYYNFDKENIKLIAKDKYYYVNDKNIHWEPLTNDSVVNGCINALIGIRRLENDFNSIPYQDAPQAGYEGIIKYYLHDTCKNLTTDDGKNAWDELSKLIEEVLADTSGKYSEAQKKTAEDDKALMEKWKDNDYVVEEGNEADKEGKKYWCLDVEEMKKVLDYFDDPTLHVQDENPGDGDKDNCYTKAGSLGWILCPIIESARTAIIESYGTLVEPALQIENGLFRAGDDDQNGTYQAWAVFRDIANLAFVIMFVLVIFSQVTGVGIDNYGVKKALPKLLMAAILINLSFIICQGAIDICNMTGKGIGGLFQRITYDSVKYPDKVKINVGDNSQVVTATQDGSWQDTNTWGKSFASNFLGNSALVILVAALGIGIVLSQGLAIIIPVFMLLISVVVAILGLVAILGIRQAAAVLLVVVSPLAFVCYILPNTKSIFDKWFKTFQGLLLAYPICSALVYGGDMAATILLNAANGNLWVLISAAVVSVAPIFIIPKVIRQSMGALSGGIAALSGRMGGYAKGKARARMENSALTNRRNYNQMMRNQKHAASASTYNARRGKAVLNGGIGNKLAKGKKLTAAQRRKYNVAMGAVNSDNQDAMNAYASSFDGIGDAAIAGRLGNNLKDGGARIDDVNMLVAGLNSIHDEDKLTATIKKLNEKGALDNLAHEDPNAYHRVAQAMQSRKDSVINQSMGKLMDKGETVSEMYSSGSLQKKVRDAGTSIMATQNKDVFNTEGAAELFSDEQLRAGLTAGYTGGTAAAFDGMMSQVSDDRMGDIVGGMTAEDVSNLKTSTLKYKANGQEVEKDVGGLATIGRGSVEAGGQFVQDHNKDAINQLNGVEGDELRPQIGKREAEALGIHSPDAGSAPAAAGGGDDSTVIDSNPNKSSISSGINVNNMTEDDYRYIQWQHDRNPGSGGSSAEGGMTIDHGSSTGGSHATGSGARAEARAAAEGSGSSTNPATPPVHTITPPAGSSVPSHSSTEAPVQQSGSDMPDLSHHEDTGTFRDNTGNAIRERAKEGNYFDYHPKQKGETNQDYSDRNKYEKALQAYGEANPRGKNETMAEYNKRIQAPSFDSWRSGGKGEIKLPGERGKPASGGSDSGPKISTNHHKS